MSDLDKKLDEILDEYHTPSDDMNPSCRSQWGQNTNKDCDCGLQESKVLVKQAFIDAGWHEPLTPEYLRKMAKRAQSEYMTGQEWYDRFEKELPSHDQLKSGQNMIEGTLEAAKRAAGIDQ